MDDLISRQSALDALDKHFESFIKRFGYDSYERADEKTKLVCDGLSEAEDVIIGLPSATDTNVGTKLVIDPYKIECAIRGLTEWQKHVQTESDIDRDISVAVEALKAQLGTDLAEVGTDCISRQRVIEALGELATFTEDWSCHTWMYTDDVYNAIKQLPPIQPEHTCVNCGRTANNGGWYADGRTRCPIEEHYALPKDGYCHLWEKRNVTDDDYPERREK